MNTNLLFKLIFLTLILGHAALIGLCAQAITHGANVGIYAICIVINLLSGVRLARQLLDNQPTK